MSAINQAAFDCVIDMFPPVPPQLEMVRSFICPLANRVTKDWKVLLTDCSTIIAITGVFVTFAYGMTFFCAALTFVAISSGINCFYMRRFDELTDFAETARGVRADRDRIAGMLGTVEAEVTHLTQTNIDLNLTSERNRVNNEFLTQNVVDLTLRVTDLTESADKIQEEVLNFQEKNKALGLNVGGIDQCLTVLKGQISASRGLGELITNRLATHDATLGQQLVNLQQYIEKLRREDSLEVQQKIVQLGTLNNQVNQALTNLSELQRQSAQETGRLEAVHEAFVNLKGQFEASFREGNLEFRSNLTVLQQNIVRLLTPAARPASGPVAAPRTGHPVPPNPTLPATGLSVSTRF